MRTRSSSPAPSGPGLSQIEFEMPSRPRSWTRPARRSVRTASPERPSCAPACGRKLGDGRCVAEAVRRLEVDEVRDGQERGVEALAGEHHGQRRLGVDHRVPGADGIEVREDHLGLRRHEPRELGIELLAGAPAGERLRRIDPSDPVRHLGELPELREPRRERNVLALEVARPPAPVPLLVRPAERVEHAVGQPELLAQRTRDGGVVDDHVVDLLAPGERELEPDPEAVQRRVPGPDPAHRRSHRPRAPELVVVLDGLQRDVVPEPLGLLVRVRVAADVDEQGRVVDDRALVLVEPDALGEPERDQALPQDVLHRLPETEIDAERERARPAPPAAPARRRSRSSRAEATPAAGARQARRRMPHERW